MASSSKDKAKRYSPRFYGYVNGLRDAFEMQSHSTLERRSSSRFNGFLDGLKCEFELMTEDIESLRKENDELKVKVDTQAVELRNIRNRVLCHGCSRGTASTTITSSALLKAMVSSPTTPIVQRKSDQQPVTETTSWGSYPVLVHSQIGTLPSTTIGSNSRPEKRDCSATFSDVSVGGNLSFEMAHALPHRGPIWSVYFSQDGKYLAAGCHDGKSYVYDVPTGALLCVLRNLFAEKDIIKAVCFSRDGKYLATGSGYEGIYIWEINTRYVRNAFQGLWIRSLDFSPNGRLLVSASENNIILLWNMRDGTRKSLTDDNPAFLDSHSSAVFSPDGKHVASSNRDGMVRVWHVRTGQLIRRLKAHVDIAFDVGFTPDGNGLITAGSDKTLKYWDFSYWSPTCIRARSQMAPCVSVLEEQTLPKREYLGHDHSVYCLAISPDGRWVASASLDGTVGIWNTRLGAMQCSLNHEDWALSVDFNPTGHYLASGGRDGTVRLWRYIRRFGKREQ